MQIVSITPASQYPGAKVTMKGAGQAINGLANTAATVEWESLDWADYEPLATAVTLSAAGEIELRVPQDMMPGKYRVRVVTRQKSQAGELVSASNWRIFTVRAPSFTSARFPT